MSRPHRKIRADQLALGQELAGTLNDVRALIIAGEVRSGDQLIWQPSQFLSEDVVLEIAPRAKFVSRGGFKLESIIRHFNIPVPGRTAADIGASTGGFTDCLLQYGISRVYAIDAGYGQLEYSLRTDDRVVVMERTNARYLDYLPEPVQIVTIDVSFISLKHILPVAASISSGDADIIALVKPQFEAEKDEVDRRGVVVAETVRKSTVERVHDYGQNSGLCYQGMMRSPLTGPAGNQEFLLWYSKVISESCFQNDILRVFTV